MEHPLKVTRQEVLGFRPGRGGNVKHPDVSVLTSGGDDVGMSRAPIAAKQRAWMSVDTLHGALFAEDYQTAAQSR